MHSLGKKKEFDSVERRKRVKGRAPVRFSGGGREKKKWLPQSSQEIIGCPPLPQKEERESPVQGLRPQRRAKNRGGGERWARRNLFFFGEKKEEGEKKKGVQSPAICQARLRLEKSRSTKRGKRRETLLSFSHSERGGKKGTQQL